MRKAEEVVGHQEECRMVCAADSVVEDAEGRLTSRRKERVRMGEAQKLAVLERSSRRGWNLTVVEAKGGGSR
jgi:hypothetical protein